jgi:hypothetical protein
MVDMVDLVDLIELPRSSVPTLMKMLRPSVRSLLTIYQPYQIMFFLYLVRRIPEWLPATCLTPSCQLLSRRQAALFFALCDHCNWSTAWILLLLHKGMHDRKIRSSNHLILARSR